MKKEITVLSQIVQYLTADVRNFDIPGQILIICLWGMLKDDDEDCDTDQRYVTPKIGMMVNVVELSNEWKIKSLFYNGADLQEK